MKEIKNLNQLKKALVLGARFNIVKHFVHPEFTGQKRIVQAVQSNAIFSGVINEPDNTVSKANNGKGVYLGFGKASTWEFKDGLCTSYNVWNTWEGGKQVEKRTPAFTLEVVA